MKLKGRQEEKARDRRESYIEAKECEEEEITCEKTYERKRRETENNAKSHPSPSFNKAGNKAWCKEANPSHLKC